MRILLALAISLWAVTGCDECIEVNSDCAPLYAPTFEEVFTRTLSTTCAAPGSSCHAAAGAQGGLVLEDRARAYQLLVDEQEVVLPGDPGCSMLVRRIESTEADFGMPPGRQLPPEERCAIIQWVANGAPQ